MNALVVQINDINIEDIVISPHDYSDELVTATIDVLNDMSRQIKYAKYKLSTHIKSEMTKSNSTKMKIIGNDGVSKTATLKNGAMECKNKNADLIYRKAGFDPLEIGSFEFVPSWSRAKEARKFGGKKKEIIDLLFIESGKILEIK